MLQVFSASATCLNPQYKTTAVRLSYFGCFGCFVGLLKDFSLFFSMTLLYVWLSMSIISMTLLARVHTVSQVCLKKESKMAALKRRPVKKVNLSYTHDVFLFSKTDIGLGVWGGMRVIYIQLLPLFYTVKSFILQLWKKVYFILLFKFFMQLNPTPPTSSPNQHGLHFTLYLTIRKF